MGRELDASRNEVESLRGKLKASQVKRRELSEKLLEISDNSSSNEANIEALAEGVEKVNDEKLNLRRELEGLTIRMSQELEARIAIEDLIKERDQEIIKSKWEKDTMHENLIAEIEEKENLKLDLELASSLKENLSKHNGDLVKKITEANEKLEKFVKSSTMLEEQIQSQRMKGDIFGLSFHTTKKGECSGTKSNYTKNKTAPKVNKTTDKKVFKPVCFVCRKPGHTANVYRDKPTEMQITILMIGMYLESLKAITSHVECMGIEMLSADMEQKILYHTCILDQMVTK